MTAPEPRNRFELDPAPDRHPRPPRLFKVPLGAVDVHAHVIGTTYIEERSYTPRPAPEEAYLRMLDNVGMTYGVLVQVSVHGTDNSVMLQALKSNRRRLRGIAVVHHDASDQELETLKSAGVVGLRLNTTTGGGVGVSRLDCYADMCKDLGWHLEFLVEPRQLAPLVSKVSALQVPAVFDHMGYVHAGPGMEEPRQALLQLVRNGAWVKLSAAYRLSHEAPPYADTVTFTGMLVDAAPHRCVWGSDWPHVKYRGPMPNPGELLDVLAAAIPDPGIRQAVLADNAQRLYDFQQTLPGAPCR